MIKNKTANRAAEISHCLRPRHSVVSVNLRKQPSTWWLRETSFSRDASVRENAIFFREKMQFFMYVLNK